MEIYDQIKTIKYYKEIKYKEKGSVFWGKAYPVNSVEKCEEILTGLKKEFYDATHYCYAFKLINNVLKYSDDGEPNGTAGIRILNAIEHFSLVEVLCVVIRYFGGVKLGVGPLGKAYYNSAYQVLDSSEIIIKNPYKKIFISVEFPLLSNVYRILSNHNVIIRDTTYDSKANLTFLAEVKTINQINQELTEISKGEIPFTEFKEVEYL